MSTNKPTIRIRSVKQSVLDGDAPARDNNVRLRCGECIHYKGSAHASFGEPCADLGVRPGSVAPDCYTPNASLLRPLGTDAFAQLAAFLSASSPQQARIIAGLLKSAAGLERAGFQFLQRVYFHIGGSDPTLDRVYSGYVLGVGLDKQIQVIGSDYMKQSKGACVATLDRSSLMNDAQFSKFKQKLLSTGRITALPSKNRNTINDGYEPPTFDTAPEVLEALANKAVKHTRVKKGSKPELDKSGKGRSRANPNGTLFSVSEDDL